MKVKCPAGASMFTRHESRHEEALARAFAEVSAPHGCLSVFQIRDPRDVAVSQYQSFTTENHLILKGQDRDEAMAKRAMEHDKGVDRYVLENWDSIEGRYEMSFVAEAIHRQHCATFMSNYSDMVERPELWGGTYGSFVFDLCLLRHATAQALSD